MKITLRYQEGEWRLLGTDIVLCTGEVLSVCSEMKPIDGARALVRIGEFDWILTPARYRASDKSFQTIPDAVFLHLSGAPVVVNDILSKIIL